MSAANSFWNITDVNFQLKNFGFVDSHIELMRIRETMLAVKNMNEVKLSTLWENIDLKSESHVQWLKNWYKKKPNVS